MVHNDTTCYYGAKATAPVTMQEEGGVHISKLHILSISSKVTITVLATVALVKIALVTFCYVMCCRAVCCCCPCWTCCAKGEAQTAGRNPDNDMEPDANNIHAAASAFDSLLHFPMSKNVTLENIPMHGVPHMVY